MKEVKEKEVKKKEASKKEVSGDIGVVKRGLEASTGQSQRLSELRQEINQVDQALVELLTRRFTAVTEIAGIKEKSGLAIFDENREREILSAVSEQLKDSELKPEILEVFSAMLVSSKKAQAKLLGRG